MKMKKTLLALALGTATGLLVVPAVFAQDAPTDNAGWFVNANVGRTMINQGPYNGHDTGYALGGGYRWSLAPNFALGAELGYNDLGNIRASNIFNGQPVVDPRKSQLHGWTVGANGRVDLNSSWYLSGRAGLYSWNGHGLSNNSNPIRYGINNNSWYAGAGIGYNISDNLSVGLHYDYFDARKHNVNLSTDMVSASFEYRF